MMRINSHKFTFKPSLFASGLTSWKVPRKEVMKIHQTVEMVWTRLSSVVNLTIKQTLLKKKKRLKLCKEKWKIWELRKAICRNKFYYEGIIDEIISSGDILSK